MMRGNTFIDWVYGKKSVSKIKLSSLFNRIKFKISVEHFWYYLKPDPDPIAITPTPLSMACNSKQIGW